MAWVGRAWVVVVVVAWVTCFSHHAHGQLGVVGVEEGTAGLVAFTTTTTATTTTTTTDQQQLPDNHGEGEQGEEEGGVTGRGYLKQGRRWRPLQETYQGCYYQEQLLNGTLMYVNLSQVMEVDNLNSEEDACFHLCRAKKPLSWYIAVSPFVSSTGGMDQCGCQDLLDIDDEVDGEECDGIVNYYRVYCGPGNDECLNKGIKATSSKTIIFFLSLASIIRYLTSNYDV